MIKEITRGLLFPEGPVAMSDGSVLVVEIQRGTLTRVNPDGSHMVIARPGGGPNGAAIGPDGACFVCNNGGFQFHQEGELVRTGLQSTGHPEGRIERIDLNTGRIDVLYTSAGDVRLCAPNDLVFDATGGFWFTDRGQYRVRDQDRTGVFYARADGSMIKEVIHPMISPNGIALSPGGDRLYVAETLPGRIWAFDILAPGEVKLNPWPSPNGASLLAGLAGYQLIDSMAIDCAGNICAATLYNGGITVISPDGRIIEHIPMPDILTTNICFGGPDLRTAYITLGSTGRLVSMEWPRPGLRLQWQA
jgi:gluconolactonase